MTDYQELIELIALLGLTQICTINLSTLLDLQIAYQNPVLTEVIIIILGQVVIILNQAIIILDQAIIITNHPEAQIIQVLATLDQVLDIAHHQVHHFP